MKFNKNNLLEQIMQQLENDRIALLEATKATLEAATHEESKPENEYDTRGLEASYLAGAQSKRVGEIEEALMACRQLKLKDFAQDEAIASTAIIEIGMENKTNWVFLLPKGGGLTLTFEGRKIQVVTGSSPLGEALIGLKVGDIATVDVGRKSREVEVLSVY